MTLVAAAVAVAIDQSRQAAMEDVLLDRERAAMRAADAEAQLAERVRCARCGDTSNLEVMPQPFQRSVLQVDCLHASWTL